MCCRAVKRSFTQSILMRSIPDQAKNVSCCCLFCQVNDDGTVTRILTWHDVRLTQQQRRMQQAHKYVTDSHRAYEAVRNELIRCLINFIDNRLETTELMNIVPVIFNPQHWIDKLASDADFTEAYGNSQLSSLRNVYMPDLDKSSLVSEFTLLKAEVKNRYSAQIDNAPVMAKLNRNMLLKLAIQLDLPVFAEAAARMLSLFPHSMYVERLVSSHNLIKSGIRASMSRDTINDYLIVKESMGPVASFDPRPSIAKWLSQRQRRPKTSESQEKLQRYTDNDFVKTFFSNTGLE